MRIGVIGGTGFLGTHLIQMLRENDHEVVIIAREHSILPDFMELDSQITRRNADILDVESLQSSMTDCDAVAHLAGINYERRNDTFDAVHVRGTQAIVEAAVEVGVTAFSYVSYLRARPDASSGYFSSKWRGEEIVRNADIPWTIVKPAAIFGPGDQFVTHLAQWLSIIPVRPRIGWRGRRLRPVAVTDVARILLVGLMDQQLNRSTVPAYGPEILTLDEVAERIAEALNKRTVSIPTPPIAMYLGAWMQEYVLRPPIITRAGVRMLSEGMIDPAPPGICDPLPAELHPRRRLSREYLETHFKSVPPIWHNRLRG